MGSEFHRNEIGGRGFYFNNIINEIGAGTLEPHLMTGKISNRDGSVSNAQFRVIPLNKVEFNAAQMILPSLQTGVGTL